jgi:hypothetical protein
MELTKENISENLFYVSIGLMYAVGFPVAEMVSRCFEFRVI